MTIHRWTKILLAATVLWSVGVNTRTGAITCTAMDTFQNQAACEALVKRPQEMTTAWQHYRYVHMCLPEGQRPEVRWVEMPVVPSSEPVR